MPGNDLVLNVRQIANYPATGNAPTSASVLMQTAGIGSPYASISPQALVSTALSTGGDMAVGGQVSALSFQGGSAQFSNAAVNMLSAQQACLVELNATYGSIAGAPIATQAFVSGLIANTVWSFNGRRGDVTLWIQDIVKAGGAPIFSPRFFGTPAAETPAPWSNSSRLATTAFVHRAIVQYLDNFPTDHPFVFTFNGRTGDIVLTAADVENALAGSSLGYAPIDSPDFTGVPQGPTASAGSSTSQLATTAFVMNAVADSVTGVASFNARTGNVTLQSADLSNAGGALLNSPAFTGNPQAPTAAPGDSSAAIATTAFVANAVANSTAGVTSFNTRTGAVTFTAADLTAVGGALAVSTVASFNSRVGAVTLQANDVSAVGGALLASPAFTGSPTAPTANAGTNTTQLATCAFVMAAIAGSVSGVSSFNTRTGAVTLTQGDVTTVLPASATLPLMNGTASAGTANAWACGDHVHPTDTSRAPLASPAFSGTPSAPTATAGTSTTQIASTAFVAAAVAATGAIKRVVERTFTASGTYTPTTGMAYCLIECQGGGGGGGGAIYSQTSGQGVAGGGGGSGGYSFGLATAAQIGASQTVTIGAGGAAGTATSAGGSGGATSVGTLVTAGGGGGGTIMGAPSGSWMVQGGSGGNAGTTTISGVAFPGNAGGTGETWGSMSFGGQGGAGHFGGGPITVPLVAAGSQGGPAGSAGSGGSGAATVYSTPISSSGGVGGSGVCVITEFCTQ